MEKQVELTPQQLMDKARKRLMWLLRAILLIFVLVIIQMQTTYIKINTVDVSTNTDLSIEPLKIVHISDLHGKLFSGKQSKLKVIFDKTDYDIVVITGNLVDKKTVNFKPVEFLLDYFQKEGKVVLFVSGKHEAASQHYAEVKEIMDKYGVINIDNDVYNFKTKSNRSVSFIGLSDPDLVKYSESDPIVSKLLMEAKANGEQTILLSHRPYYFDNYKENADLILSGHNHGGQIRLPFVGGVFSPDGGFFPDYDYGLYDSPRSSDSELSHMYVNKGLGNDVIPIRLFNFPEVAQIIFK